MKQVINLVHQSVGGTDAEYEDTEFIIQLALFAMLGDAILGKKVRSRMDVPDIDHTAGRFRTKLQELLTTSLPRKA